jgi:hypothetical protein
MTWLDDLQRRLAIAGARSLGQGFADQVSRTFRGESTDVWETATEEAAAGVIPGEAPECAWCPVCRAIRMARESRPDLASRVGETAEALVSAAHDVASAIDAALSRMPAPPSPGPSAGAAPPGGQGTGGQGTGGQGTGGQGTEPDAPPSPNGKQG